MTCYDHRLCTLVKQVMAQGQGCQGRGKGVRRTGEKAGKGFDLGGSAAQSVVLMLIVIALTVLQFRYVERISSRHELEHQSHGHLSPTDAFFRRTGSTLAALVKRGSGGSCAVQGCGVTQDR